MFKDPEGNQWLKEEDYHRYLIITKELNKRAFKRQREITEEDRLYFRNKVSNLKQG